MIKNLCKPKYLAVVLLGVCSVLAAHPKDFYRAAFRAVKCADDYQCTVVIWYDLRMAGSSLGNVWCLPAVFDMATEFGRGRITDPGQLPQAAREGVVLSAVAFDDVVSQIKRARENARSHLATTFRGHPVVLAVEYNRAVVGEMLGVCVRRKEDLQKYNIEVVFTDVEGKIPEFPDFVSWVGPVADGAGVVDDSNLTEALRSYLTKLSLVDAK